MTDLFQTILTMSASAGLLALLVIGARALLARRQTVMLTVLFALLIAKLVVPLSIESPASLQNLVNTADISAIAVETPVIEQSLPDIETQLTAADTPAVVDAPAAAENTTQQNSGASGSSPEAQVIPQAAADAPPATNVESFTDNMTASEAPVLAIPDAIPQTETPPPWQPTGWDIAAIVWLSGIAVLSTVIAFSNIRFMLRLRRNRAYTAPGFDEMLSDCRKEFGIKRNIPAVQVSEINTAAVCGIFRPKLMISPRTFGALTTGQQRHVLMHEVSHIRRMDTLTCLIVTILSVVHWFNPLVWLAFRLMRSDLEVMCDAKVLKKLETDERRSYAQTLFGLIQKRGAQSVRLVAALFMSRSSIKRRITMIAKYKKTSPLFTALALLLTVLIAVTGCTSAMPNAAGEASTEETPPEFTAEYDDHDATEQNVIGEYTLDISGIASDEARMHNIEKAVGYFNDIVLTPAIEHEFYPSQVITGENNWQTARSADFDAIIQLLEDGEARSFDELMLDITTFELGGGYDLVERAVLEASRDTSVSIDSPGASSMLLDGFTMDHLYRSNVTVRAQTDGKTITVRLVCEDSDRLSLDEVAAIEGVTPNLVGTHSIDLAGYSLSDDEMQAIRNEIANMKSTLIPADTAYGISQTFQGYSELTADEMLNGPDYLVMNAIYNAAPDQLDPKSDVDDFGGRNSVGIHLSNSGAPVRLWVELRGNNIVASFYNWEQSTPPVFSEFAETQPIASHTFDLSLFADDEARMINIEKAVQLYDGTVIAPGESFDLVAPAMPISSWQIAPMLDFFNAMSLVQASNQAKQEEALQKDPQGDEVAGGMEIVAASIIHAARSYSTFTGGLETPLMERELQIFNRSDMNMVIKTLVEDNTLTVGIYHETSNAKANVQTAPVLMTSFVLDHSAHDSRTTLFNIDKALGMLDGQTIRPGGRLSVNDVLGPRNAAAGWKKAAGIYAGAFTTQYGGGVSGVATAVYNAAIRAELEIVEKSSHSIMADYVDGGLDATISTGKPDLVIGNPYDTNVTLRCRLDGTDIIVDVYGPPMEYTVEFITEPAGRTAPPEPVYHYNATVTPEGEPIPPGETMCWVKERYGTEWSVYKYRVDEQADNDADGILSDELFAKVTYRSYGAQYYVNGPAGAEAPHETAPPPGTLQYIGQIDANSVELMYSGKPTAFRLEDEAKVQVNALTEGEYVIVSFYENENGVLSILRFGE